MKISKLSNDFSFLIESTAGTVAINQKKSESEQTNTISVFLEEQSSDEDKSIHWAGEYEIGGIAVFLQNIESKKMLGKIFTENIRIVFFSDEDLSSEKIEDLEKKFGNTDVFIFKKGSNGLSESQVKKLIEEIDPRVLVATGVETIELFKKLTLPIVAKEHLSLTKSSLPKEHSEYYSL